MKGQIVLKITQIDRDTFEVVVQTGTTTQHIVKVSDQILNEFTFDKLSKEQFVKKSFLFLLKKEPNTAIMGDFNIEEIESFFPEFRNIYKVDWVNINI
ncbi:MAG: hypothetical protein CL532_04025 [Aestuariivita sp.]|nr:hypothetical protein [Aestuariivita sp.]